MKPLAALLLVAILASVAAHAQYTCGDNICQPYENSRACPKDCKASLKDNYCDEASDGTCDKDCFRSDPDCADFEERMSEQKGDPLFLLKMVFVVLFIVGAGAGIFVLYKRSLKDQNMYDTEQIDKFSNVKKEEERTWANQSETDIIKDIKESEDFQRYTDGQQNR